MFSEKKDGSNPLRRLFKNIILLFLTVFFSSKHSAYTGGEMARNSGKQVMFHVSILCCSVLGQTGEQLKNAKKALNKALTVLWCRNSSCN